MPKKLAPKTETRVWLNKGTTKKMSKDIGKLGATRSEVARTIIEDFYNGNLVSAEQMLKALERRP